MFINAIVRHRYFLAFLFLFITVFATFLGANYVVEGSLHDLWIPQISAYIMKSDLIIHKEFHAFFGILYHCLNYVSSGIIELFPNFFNKLDLIMMSSLAFSFLVIGIFCLIKINIGNKAPVSYFLLLIALSIIFQVRRISDFDPGVLSWTGVYNNHLWGILILQISHIFCIERYFKKRNYLELTKYGLFLFSLIQAIFLYITFNYKISFFVSSSLLSGSVLFLLTKEFRVKYLLYIISLFSLLLILTTLLFNYSYIGYFYDLYHVWEVRSVNKVRFFKLSLFYTGVFFLLQNYRLIFKESEKNFLLLVIILLLLTGYFYIGFFKAFPVHIPGITVYGTAFVVYLGLCFLIKNIKPVCNLSIIKIFDFLKRNIIYSIRSIRANKSLLAKNLFFEASIIFAVSTSILGQWTNPEVCLLIILSVYLILSGGNNYFKIIGYSFLLLILLINITSLILLAKNKFYEQEPAIFIQGDNYKNYKKNKRHRKATLEVDNGLNLVLKKHVPFYSMRTSKTKTLDNIFREASYKYFPRNNEKKKGRNVKIRVDYVDMINYALNLFRRINPDNVDKIMMLEFTNPLPVFLNLSYPKDSYHWIHNRATFSGKEIHKLNEVFDDSDFVYVPLYYSIRRKKSFQRFMNCVFYEWNFRNKKFTLFDVSNNGLFFATEEKIEQYDINPVKQLNKKKVMKYCNREKKYFTK